MADGLDRQVLLVDAVVAVRVMVALEAQAHKAETVVMEVLVVAVLVAT